MTLTAPSNSQIDGMYNIEIAYTQIEAILLSQKRKHYNQRNDMPIRATTKMTAKSVVIIDMVNVNDNDNDIMAMTMTLTLKIVTTMI